MLMVIVGEGGVGPVEDMNVAETLWSPFMVTSQKGELPEAAHAPAHELKAKPGSGLAVKVTVDPEAKGTGVEQVPPKSVEQEMPPGLLETDPPDG